MSEPSKPDSVPSEQSFVHTPGPWTVDKTVALGAYGVWTDSDPMKQICRVYNGVDDSLPRSERDANARLIAVSPEMFRIIQRLATADWIGEAELNLWRRECREIMQKVV